MAMYVYMWRDSHLNAIKIGYGDNPQQRMRDYARGYGMQPDAKSLITVRVPTGFDCAYLEAACHERAVELGLTDITKNGAMQEVFLLGGRTYQATADTMVEVVGSTVRRVSQGQYPTPLEVSTQTPPAPAPTPPQLPPPEVPALYHEIGRRGLEAPAGYVASPPAMVEPWTARHRNVLANAWLAMMGVCIVLFVGSAAAAMVLR